MTINDWDDGMTQNPAKDDPKPETENQGGADSQANETQAPDPLAQLEAEQNVLVASLSDTEAKPDFEGVNRRLGQIQSELATVNTLWEQAASELAFLEAE